MKTNQIRRRDNRRGAVVVLVAVSLIAIFALAALAVDTGRLYRERRNAQAAADMAAEAAGIQLFANYSQYKGKDTDGSARASALELASLNSFGRSVVSVNIPPLSGPFTAKNGYAEVIISSPMSRSFSNIFGSGNLQVQARAVAAGTMMASKASVILLDPTRKDALKLKGKSSTLQVAGDVIVNSMDKQAVKVDKRGQIIAENLLVAGGLDKKVKSFIDANVSTSVAPTTDPLAKLPPPSKGTQQTASNFKSSSGGRDVYNLLPGNYSELKFDKDASVKMSPGVYYVDGEISFKDSSSLSGSQVMIYTEAPKGIKFKSSGEITLSPPTSGTYKGVTIFQDAASKTKLEFKNDAKLSLSGIIYAPNSEVKFNKLDLEIDEDWSSERDIYQSDDDGGIIYQGGLSASIISRKLTIEKGSRIELSGADIATLKPLRGLVE